MSDSLRSSLINGTFHMNERFLNLPPDIFIRLCQINPNFNNICQLESLWQTKTQNDFPNEAAFKPLTMLWRDYYIFLATPSLTSRSVPIYLHGDQIGSTLIDPENLDLSIHSIISFVPQLARSGTIVFVDKEIKPIAAIRFPKIKTEIYSQDFDDIQKIVIFLSGDVYISPKTVYLQLTPVDNLFPVYGYTKDNEFWIITDQNRGILSEIVSNYDEIPSGQSCLDLSKLDLINILWQLKLALSGESEASYIEMLLYLSQREIKVPPEKVEFYYRWLSHDRDILCKVIKDYLEKIGHLLN